MMANSVVSDSSKLRLEQLKWRSRRSILELDLYFDRFIKSGGLDALSEAELRVYTKLLQLDDDVLLSLIQGTEKHVEFQEVIDKVCRL